MTIFVDDVGIQATVTDPRTKRTYRSRWYHLFSDQVDPAELHDFAQRIGMKRAWFQPGKQLGDGSNPAHDHYDLTANKRRQAIAAGATAVDTDRAVAIWLAKRDAVMASPREA